MQHKITGYLLFCVGLLLILFAVLSMYKVFVNQQPVIAIVQLADLKITSQFGNMVVPASGLNTIINLGLFAFFMAFLVAVGTKVATLGCNFLKIERIYEALSKGEKTLSKNQIKNL